ncbi:DUF6316 family protein [Azotobacter bryophylli]|uniref:DUF6316 family protein n=1 Tax=Azotobacter bryophylli TaxID=1986537 RepID=A0ABV7AZH8_9GAMM
MSEKRSSDQAPITHFRSDRISLINGRYYFDTREGVLKGPYASRQEAQQEVEAYIQRRQKLARTSHRGPAKTP